MFQKMSDYFQFKSTSFFYLNILIWKNHAFFQSIVISAEIIQKMFQVNRWIFQTRNLNHFDVLAKKDVNYIRLAKYTCIN